MQAITYSASLNEKDRIRLNRHGHPENSHTGVIVRALENPSNHRENQWYDVRFDSGVLGRFLERYLEPIPRVLNQERGPGGSQTSAA